MAAPQEKRREPRRPVAPWTRPRDVRKVIYSLPDIIATMAERSAGERVVVVEGEKDVEIFYDSGGHPPSRQFTDGVNGVWLN